MVNLDQMFGFAEQELAENQSVEHTTYCARLSDSICGMGFGVVLFFGMLGLSAWNEYRNVANQKTINAASEEWKQGTCSPIMAELEGQLVHVTCPVSNLEVLGDLDPVLKFIPQEQRVGIALESYMEVLAWVEATQSTTQGSTTTTTYTYDRYWIPHTPKGVTSFFNGGASCKTENNNYQCLNWDPSLVEPWWSTSKAALGTTVIDESASPMAGDYHIPKDKLIGLGSAEVLTPTCSNSSTGGSTPSPAAPTNGIVLSCSPGGDATLKNTKMYWQQLDSNNQNIDYLSRSYSIRSSEIVSILAEQKGNSFVPWTSPYDEDYYVYEVLDGNQTTDEMLADLTAANVGMTWFLRVFTLFMSIVGLVMITAPLTVIPEFIPIVGDWIGDLIGYVLWAVDCALGCCCWSFITAMAWIAYRPTVGISLLCVSCCLFSSGGYLAYRNHVAKQQNQSAAEGKADNGEEPDPEVSGVQQKE